MRGGLVRFPDRPPECGLSVSVLKKVQINMFRAGTTPIGIDPMVCCQYGRCLLPARHLPVKITPKPLCISLMELKQRPMSYARKL